MWQTVQFEMNAGTILEAFQLLCAEDREVLSSEMAMAHLVLKLPKSFDRGPHQVFEGRCAELDVHYYNA